MSVSPTYPGVYIEEIPSGVHTITGVSTSIAAFLGRTSKGPINKAVRVLSLSDYSNQFGKPHPKSDLANSVTQFFMNGGTDCYVIRLASGAVKSEVTLHALPEGILSDPVLRAVAKAEGAWGNTVRIMVDYNTLNSDESFNLTVIHEESGIAVATESFTNLSMDPGSPRFAPSFVSQSSSLIDLELDGSWGDPTDTTTPSNYNNVANSFAGFSQSRRPLSNSGANLQTDLQGLIAASMTTFEISINGSAYVSVNLSLTAVPATMGDINNWINDLINDAIHTVEPGLNVTAQFVSVSSISNQRLLTITATSGVASESTSVRIRRSSSNDVAAALMLGIDQGGVEPVRWSRFRPSPNASLLRLDTTNGGLNSLNELAGIGQDDITQIDVNGDPILLNLVTTNGGDLWYSSDTGGSVHGDNDGIREKLKIIASAINTEPGLDWSAEVWGYHLAIKTKSGNANTQPSSIAFTAAPPLPAAIPDAIALNVYQYTLGTLGAGTFTSGDVPGFDGAAPGVADYIGNESDQNGFHALDPVDLFNIMVVPGDEEVTEPTMMGFLGALSEYCESKRAFLLIDAPDSWTNNDRPAVVNNTALITDLRVLLSKKNSAVFYPHLQYNDLGLIKTIGPSGAMAGLMARTDTNRGVWKAPAGTEANLLGFLDVKVNLTDPENGVLNKEGINCIRKFPTGIVNWGARTMAGSDNQASEWKYIPIRRLALFIEESLFRGTKWVVFEPNDEPLWSKIRLNVGAFMNRLFRQGAFQGDTPNKAYFVKCDAETTPQSDRDLGIVNIVVGFAPLKPAEFVIIKIQQIAGEL